ncbi:MAPEG family protein [Acuticoccus sp.]|uniref:MAPEG family protein n=1 Tax=Acuticoccus sp. TaxID=1904378 RepID=UPI003B520037
MPIELLCVGLAGVLLLVQIMVAAAPRAMASGLSWAASPRDTPAAPVSSRAQRADRALRNMGETFPVFAAAAIAVVVADATTPTTAIGAQLYLAGRVVYVPTYLFHVPLVRSLIWAAAMLGLVLVLTPFVSALFG